MIVSLSGTLVSATPLHAIVETGGIGYEVHIPVTTAEKLPAPGTQVKLHTHAVYRDDAQTLYGFATIADRDFFRLLIENVTGIGPKSALTIMSKLSLPLLEGAIRSGDIATLADLSRLPFTTKDDFRTTYPYGLFAVALDEVVEVHSSSGTTGTPVVGGYTRADLDTWAELVARFASAAGVVAGDVAQVAFGYGMFTGGFGLHYGLQRIGALVVPHSAGNTQRQIQFM